MWLLLFGFFSDNELGCTLSRSFLRLRLRT
jgi:hypothetical protein